MDGMTIKCNGIHAKFTVPVESGCYLFPDRAVKFLSALPAKKTTTLEFCGHTWTIPPDTIPQIKAVFEGMKKGGFTLFAEVERLLK